MTPGATCNFTGIAEFEMNWTGHLVETCLVIFIHAVPVALAVSPWQYSCLVNLEGASDTQKVYSVMHLYCNCLPGRCREF